MKIATILGARPQFIKAAPVSLALRQRGHNESIIHTGQHYAPEMSDIFFAEMGIPAPARHLGVGSGAPCWQAAQMLLGLEKVLLEDKPDYVLVYGDTNSTLAGALAACKLNLPLAHVESGLRSFNREMPEEHNRVLTDHCATLLLCPTKLAVENLHRENVKQGVHWVGDTMLDALMNFLPKANETSRILSQLGLNERTYSVATLHRPYNTDDPSRLAPILQILTETGEPVILPIHPRTVARMESFGLTQKQFESSGALRFIPPLGYLDMLQLVSNSRRVYTDSGGLQKEAYLLGVPCITLRPETEWVETTENGWNVVAGNTPDEIRSTLSGWEAPVHPRKPHFGEGDAAQKIIDVLEQSV